MARATVVAVKFILSRRWLLFALAVAVLAYGCWWLGEWQFSRLEERKERNAVTERNLAAEPRPVADVLGVGEPVDPGEEWLRVRATGTYDADQSVIVRYQTRDGASGVDVVTPLRLEDSGRLLLVDRGWMATDNRGDTAPDVPEPPAGTVEVVGWVRADATGDSTARARKARGNDPDDGHNADGTMLGHGARADKHGMDEDQIPAPHPTVLDLATILGAHLQFGEQWV